MKDDIETLSGIDRMTARITELEAERGSLQAEVERLEKELSVAREAIKTQNGVVLSSVEKTIEARKKLPCGHHASSLVKSVESDTQFCEVCDIMSQRDDAVAMEEQLRAERDSWKSRAQQFQRERAKLADKLNGTPCAEIRWQCERDAIIAKLERAKNSMELVCKRFETDMQQGYKTKDKDFAVEMLRPFLTELSADAPAQQNRQGEYFDTAQNAIKDKEKKISEAERYQARSLAAKALDEAWRSRTMIPACPHCGHGLAPESFKNGVGMIGKEYAAARLKKAKDPK